ncbi:MAG TPA: hypothetical protein VGH40_06840 [Roseiarcus sp.]|jgi:hypothetical protein
METVICVGIAALAFGFGVAGLYLQKLLPDHHTSDRSRDMIGAIVGLISLLLALVLGTLVGSSYVFYSTQKSELETFASRAIQLDLALAEYGPETTPARVRMKQTLEVIYDTFWGKNAGRLTPESLTVAPVIPHLKQMDEYIAGLTPQTPMQRQFASAASVHASLIEQTRLLISLQLASPVSWPLVVIVVSWALILFLGYGLLSRVNSTTVMALGFGAFAVGSAVFLVLELSAPFTGFCRIPPGAFEQMLAAIGT